MRGLAGRRILIAGGASGIGAATARRLAQEGATLVIGDINTEGLTALVEELRATGGRAEGVYFDLADEASIVRLIDDAISHLGGLDGLVNVGADMACARAEVGHDLLDVNGTHWERTLRINVTGHALACRAAIPHMLRTGGGAIVGISSAASYAGSDDLAAYASSKAALHALIRHIARRWGKDRVRCNGVAPGVILTDTAKRAMATEAIEAALASVPHTRLGQPEDVAAAVAFLLSDDAEWITGQVLSINGGSHFRD